MFFAKRSTASSTAAVEETTGTPSTIINFLKRLRRQLVASVRGCVRAHKDDGAGQSAATATGAAARQTIVARCAHEQHVRDHPSMRHAAPHLCSHGSSEWFDSFLEPLSFTRVDDTELLLVLEAEQTFQSAAGAFWDQEGRAVHFTVERGLGHHGSQCTSAAQRKLGHPRRSMERKHSRVSSDTADEDVRSHKA